LGQTSGLLPRPKLTTESAIQVNLNKETVCLLLYPGKAPNGQKVWYVLLDASEAGLAHELGVNYAPKLANIGNGRPDCVQTVSLENRRRRRTASGLVRSTSRVFRTSAPLGWRSLAPRVSR
jgi:hypothetical protein